LGLSGSLGTRNTANTPTFTLAIAVQQEALSWSVAEQVPPPYRNDITATLDPKAQRDPTEDEATEHEQEKCREVSGDGTKMLPRHTHLFWLWLLGLTTFPAQSMYGSQFTL
jgi:hypothetical protein